MPKLRLLPGEQEELRLRPHVLSFGPQFIIAAMPAIIGALLYWWMSSNAWNSAREGWWGEVLNALSGGAPAAYGYTILSLAIVGAIFAVAGIRWRIFFAYLAAGILAVAVTIWVAQDAAVDSYTWMLPVVLGLTAAPGVLGVELYRRSHRYILTNLRVLFRGGLIVTRERQLRYESITDLDGSQGPFGRLFGYGTLIPVTQSGFGLGEDTSEAMIGMGAGAKAGAKAGVAGGGVGAGIGVAAGGGKGVNTGRARTFHQLTGVAPYGDVKYLLETLVQNATVTPYLRQQVELQQQMVEAMRGMRRAPLEGAPMEEW